MDSINLLRELETNYGSFSKAQKQAADCIIKDPLAASYSTIEQLAYSAQISTTTIVRLAAVLGYKGYADFQHALQNCIQDEMVPSLKLAVSYEALRDKDNLIADICVTQTDQIEKTVDSLDVDVMHRLVSKIAEANRVYVMGGRSCYCVANYLAYNINRIQNNGVCISPSDNCLAEIMNQMSPKDVFIAVTLPRYIKNVALSAELAKKAGAYVVAITDSYRAPLTSFSDECIRVEYKSFDFHNSVLPCFIICEIIISLLTSRNPEEVRDNLTNIEKTLRTFDVHSI